MVTCCDGDSTAILHGYGTIIGTGNAIMEWPCRNWVLDLAGEVIKSLIVPAHPHPVLCPEKNEGWQKIRDAYDNARKQIEESDADLIIIYSTLWPSVIGHQISGP